MQVGVTPHRQMPGLFDLVKVSELLCDPNRLLINTPGPEAFNIFEIQCCNFCCGYTIALVEVEFLGSLAMQARFSLSPTKLIPQSISLELYVVDLDTPDRGKDSSFRNWRRPICMLKGTTIRFVVVEASWRHGFLPWNLASFGGPGRSQLSVPTDT